MAKTENINVRIDPAIKMQAEQLYAQFGITISDAINIFLRKSIMEGGLPFDMKQRYNEETEAAIREARAIAAGEIEAKSYSSVKSLFEELDAEMDDE